jgi:hypothetical protein
LDLNPAFNRPVVGSSPCGEIVSVLRTLSKVTVAAERVRTQSLDQALRAIESPEFDRALETALQRESYR